MGPPALPVRSGSRHTNRMKTLIQSLMDRTPGRWDVVLVIGAGAGSSVAFLRQGDPAHLLLTEAQPDQAELLARAIDPERGEESRAVAVCAGGREAILRQCSNARFNSFGIATGRASLLPNLSDTGELRVPAVALRDLVADAGIEPTGRNLLVVESPGQLAPLLGEPEALQVFSAIIAKVGEVPLYEGDPDPAALLEILLEAGFDPAGSDPEAIYPVAVLGFARNDARVENKRLRARVEAAERELAAQEAAGNILDQVRAQLDAVTTERDQLSQSLAAAQKALEAAQTDAAGRVAGQQEELDRLQAQSAEVNARLEQATAKAASLEERLSSVTAERDDLSGVATTIRSELDAARRQCEETASALAMEQEALAKAKASTEEQCRQAERLKGEVKELADNAGRAKESAALAIRLQTIRENDLEELRQRFEKLHEAYQAQRELLGKLSARLVIANDYFQQLASEGIQIADRSPRRRDLAAKARRVSSRRKPDVEPQ